MVWKAKLSTQTLRINDVREIIRFAWLPKIIGPNVVWLAQYQIKQIYWLTEYPLIESNKIAQVYEWKTIGTRILAREVEVVN